MSLKAINNISMNRSLNFVVFCDFFFVVVDKKTIFILNLVSRCHEKITKQNN